MGLHYLTFAVRNLEITKKLTPVRIMNSAGLNSKNIVNNVNMLNDSVVMNHNSGNNIGIISVFYEQSWMYE